MEILYTIAKIVVLYALSIWMDNLVYKLTEDQRSKNNKQIKIRYNCNFSMNMWIIIIIS